MLIRLLAAVFSGLALVLVSPGPANDGIPDGWHWLVWVSFVPLILAMRPGDTKGNVIFSFIAGYACISSSFFWLSESIVRFSNIPAFLALQLIHLFAFAFAFPFVIVFSTVQPLRTRFGPLWMLLFPTIQVAADYGLPALFPYSFGATQYRNLYAWQFASVTGVTGVTWLLMFTNAVIAEGFMRKAVPWRWVALAVALLGADLGYGAWRVEKVDAEVAAMPRLRISQLQQSITMEDRMKGSPRQAMNDWLKLSMGLRGNELDLVVWPEGATPYDPRGGNVGKVMGDLAKVLGAPVLFGGGYAEEKVDELTGRRYIEQRNSVYMMGEDGVITDRYDKMVPLPFGEYLPLADVFPVLKEIIRGPGDFAKGTRSVAFPVQDVSGRQLHFSTPICYEAILGHLVRDKLSDDVELFVVVTNDGWFGDTAAPHQHGMLSAVRSMELGIPMYRLAYTGVSFLITPTGRVLYETAPFTEVKRIVEVPAGRVDTVYSHIGDAFPIACTLVGVGLSLGYFYGAIGRMLARKGEAQPSV